MKRPNPQWEVDVFNAAVKVGDFIEYSEVIGMGEPVRYPTESEAQVLGGHRAVVWLVGKRGCVPLSHCKSINPIHNETNRENRNTHRHNGVHGATEAHRQETQRVP